MGKIDLQMNGAWLSMIGLCLAGISTAQGQTLERWLEPQSRTTYVLVHELTTHSQALANAKAMGGYLWVISNKTEWDRVSAHFGFPRATAIHVGLQQRADGREPSQGWYWLNNEAGYAPFNGAKTCSPFPLGCPDDGAHGWGFQGFFIGDGLSLFWGPNAGKNEDFAVVWTDNHGYLEDVGQNHKAWYMVEIPAPKK